MPQFPQLAPSPLPPHIPASSEAAVFVQRLVQPVAVSAAAAEAVIGAPSMSHPVSGNAVAAEQAASVPAAAAASPVTSDPAIPNQIQSVPGSAAIQDLIAKALANPALLAGGALLAGLAIGKLLATQSSSGFGTSRNAFADEVAEAILRRTGAANAPVTDENPSIPAPESDFVTKLLQEFKPQAARAVENLTKMLADLLRK